MSPSFTAEQAFNPHYKSCGFWYMDRIAHVKMSKGARRTICELINFAGKDGKAYPSVELLAERLMKSVRQVQRYLRELEVLSLIRRAARFFNGERSSNLFHFLWVESLFGAGSVTTPPAKVSPKVLTQKNTEYTENNPQEPLAHSASAALPAPDQGSRSQSKPDLEPLKKAMEQAQKAVAPQTETAVNLNSAVRMLRALEDALERPVSIQEAAAKVRELEDHGKRLKKWKRWNYVSGMILFAFNKFAPRERQTERYRGENGVPQSTYNYESPNWAELAEVF